MGRPGNKTKVIEMSNMHDSEGFNKILDEKRFHNIKKFFKGDSCLEIGCGNMSMTHFLLASFYSVTAIDPETGFNSEIISYT